ncbi:hypothetical protein [Halosimplex pelagicum]|uniref:DUF2268 domain-containing protein n=1 Tax=Halosimplex pelagicum TaxID=869886 RepID=A0A7D5TVZ8_9EURY|nr:hypothetical protein [Halosimplex pelagicum]QLH83614.1 hypothetical protein HZS54_19130 [Halosimplex pelagicum]
MRIDATAVERSLSYLDGEVPLERIWEHPAYDVVREHADLLDRDLSREDVARALAGEDNAFSGVADLPENRDQIRCLLERVRSNEDGWVDRIEAAIERVTPDEDHADLTVYLGVGYDYGVGGERGAYLNLNAPLFLDAPREVLYTATHECSHVLYERVHHSRRALGPDTFEEPAGQRTVFDTVVHTEAFATYTPIPLRRADGAMGERDDPVAEDYAVLSDEERLADLVGTYDSLRESLGESAVPRDRLFTHLFGGRRLPYRVGTAILTGLEAARGIEAVREAFYCGPSEFCTEYDWVLDEYRTDA